MNIVSTASPMRDSWGNVSKQGQCGCKRESAGRTTWFLCNHDASGYIEYADGTVHAACKHHLSGAKRQRSKYSNSPANLYDFNGELTHYWVKTSGRKGYFLPREKRA